MPTSGIILHPRSRHQSILALGQVLLLVIFGMMVGCASVDETLNWPADKLYKEAKRLLDDGQYDASVKYYEKLEARYPYGAYTEQGQIDSAYAYYKQSKTSDVVAVCDRFLKQHPRDKRGDYLYYLKGVALMNESAQFFFDFGTQQKAHRDADNLYQARDTLIEGIRMYPNSKYVVDSRKRVNEIIGSLASHEIYIAHFYLARKAYVAAVNRAQGVLHDYPQVQPSVLEALDIMVQSYDALNLPVLRDDAKRVLDLNRGNNSNSKQ